MVNPNLAYAPQPKMVDGMLAVPMDIQTISATLTFDAGTSSASGDATINYTTGKQNGYPVFDLRQTITAAWVDGVPITPADLASHDFGGGTDAEMRIVNVFQLADTTHILRVQYTLGPPDVPVAGSYQPALVWSAGPRLVCNFGLSDLGAGRYLESWVPANLIYDQFQLTLEIILLNSPTVAHTVITNGTVTVVGTHHWSIVFPSRFTSLSMMVEIRALDTLANHNDTVVLPVSGITVTVEAWKLTSTPDALSTYVNSIKTFLIENENDVGPYIHGNRFVAFMKGSMEYEGGTTSGVGPLRHETYHSWWARGVKPARQQDGWWDEGWTVYHDGGASATTPFNFANPPVTLCTENEWERITPSIAYTSGATFWEGIASMLGVSTLQDLMREFYNLYKGGIAATFDFETFLLRRTGNTQIVNAFHRFAYGFTTPSPAPDLWLRDAIGDPGNNYWSGAFWNSPDLWVRNSDDDGLAHQSPEYGQDNWFYARVRNRSMTATAKHFVVTFNPKTFAGTEFSYPADFLPCVAAVAGFNLGPGETKIVKARWPRASVPPEGTHSCLLASVLTSTELPAAGAHVWEHNNLAQKNLTIVDMTPGDFIILPFVIANSIFQVRPQFSIELVASKKNKNLKVSLMHNSPATFVKRPGEKFKFFSLHLAENEIKDAKQKVSEDHPDHANDHPGLITSSTVKRLRKFFPTKVVDRDFGTVKGKIPVLIPYANSYLFALKIQVPKKELRGESFLLNIIQREKSSKKVVGGIAVQLTLK